MSLKHRHRLSIEFIISMHHVQKAPSNPLPLFSLFLSFFLHAYFSIPLMTEIAVQFFSFSLFPPFHASLTIVCYGIAHVYIFPFPDLCFPFNNPTGNGSTFLFTLVSASVSVSFVSCASRGNEKLRNVQSDICGFNLSFRSHSTLFCLSESHVDCFSAYAFTQSERVSSVS